MKDNIRLLIVDDDRITRFAIQKILEKSDHNFTFSEAFDAESTINIVKNEQFDCIILDYVLADTDGIALLKKFQSMNLSTPVIMLTSQGDELLAVKAIKLGAYDYLSKMNLSDPNFSDIISHSILNAINLHHAEEERIRARISLEMSEERYRSLVEHSPILILRFFPEDKMICFINDGFCNYYNLMRYDVLGENFLDFIAEENHEEINRLILSLNQDHQIDSFENFTKTDKETRWQIWIIQALFDDEGGVLEYQCMGEDITEIKIAEKRLNIQKLYLQSIIDSQDNMILVSDGRNVIEANNSFLEFFGYISLEDFKKNRKGISDQAVEIEGYISKPDDDYWSGLLSGSSTQNLTAFQPDRFKNPKIFSVNVSSLSIDEGGFVITFSDVTELEEKSQDFAKKAAVDPLTKIYNRRKFDEILAHEIEVSKRYNIDLSIIFLDIDHFKKVNDTHGHQVGDYILVELAGLISNNIRKADIFARWGGEEFILLLPHTSLDDAVVQAERFRKNIYSRYFKEVSKISCSFGVTKYRKSDSADTFIQRADKALYKAKESGRNKVVAFKDK